MARMAPSHGGSPAIQRLASRIINAQNDEIAPMQTWLRDRLKPVPAPDPRGMKMSMNGMEHVMLMPGMLTDAQMQRLEAILRYCGERDIGMYRMATALAPARMSISTRSYFVVSRRSSAYRAARSWRSRTRPSAWSR